MIKPNAASAEPMKHTGRAVAFEGLEAMHKGVDLDSPVGRTGSPVPRDNH